MQTLWSGTLRKMRVQAADPVEYFLSDGWWEPQRRSPDHPLNPHLGSRLEIRFTGRIHCTACGRPTKRTFGQGFCFPCSQSLAEADICIVKPELCHHGDPADPCRDEAFARDHCFQPHVLYCALTSGVKVGITRRRNIPTRWIDQGAVAAIPLALLPDRRTVGLLEKRLSDEGFADKTHWTRMLKGDPDPGGARSAGGDTGPGFDLAAAAESVLAKLQEWGVDGRLPRSERKAQHFRYPVLQWPAKVASFNLDKVPAAGGVLEGIKGQYLIFADGVINLRKYTGYQVEVSAG